MDPQELKAARQQLQGCLLSFLTPPGVLAGLESIRDCMKDEDLRPFLGHALLHEVMPSMGLHRLELEPLVMAVCRDMEQPLVAQPLALLLENGVRAWQAQVLPMLLRYADREDELPPCLCMSLAALIMLFSGARQEENGQYTYLKAGEPCVLNEDEEILSSFARLSCDMPPEMMAYAALSDRAIWDTDLRQVAGLEALITDQLRDLQLLGLRAALEKAWKSSE